MSSTDVKKQSEEISRWASEQFGQHCTPQQIESLLRGKDGDLYGRMFRVFIEQVVSKKQARQVREANEVYHRAAKLDELNEKLTSQFEFIGDDVLLNQDRTSSDLNKQQGAYLSDLIDVVKKLQARQSTAIGNQDKLAYELKRAVAETRAAVECIDDLGPAGGDLGQREIFNLRRDEMVDEIDATTEEINGLLYDIFELLESSKQTFSKLEQSVIGKLMEHRCQVRSVHLKPDPIQVERLDQPQRKHFESKERELLSNLLEKLNKMVIKVEQNMNKLNKN